MVCTHEEPARKPSPPTDKPAHRTAPALTDRRGAGTTTWAEPRFEAPAIRNDALGRVLRRSVAQRRLMRLARTAPDSDKPDSLDIATMSAPDCYAYLRYLDEHHVEPPCHVDLKGAGRVEYATNDRALLENRMRAQIPNVISELQVLLRTDASEFNARNITAINTGEAAELVADIAATPSFTGFTEWLLASAAKWIPRTTALGEVTAKRHQRLDQINELREAVNVLVRHGTADISEQAIPGAAAETADITAAGEQTEVKTIREPIVQSADLNKQIGQSCSKFRDATSSTNRIVIYASCSTALLKGEGNTRLDVTTGKLFKTRGKPPKEVPAGHLWTEPLKALNGAGGTGIPGASKVERIIVRLENGPSFDLERPPGSAPWKVRPHRPVGPDI